MLSTGWWFDQVWDLIRHLNAMLASDAIALAPAQPEAPAHLTVLGAHPVHVDLAARVEPHVVVDATAGPVLVRRGATVQARLDGSHPRIHSAVAQARLRSYSRGRRAAGQARLLAKLQSACREGPRSHV